MRCCSKQVQISVHFAPLVSVCVCYCRGRHSILQPIGDGRVQDSWKQAQGPRLQQSARSLLSMTIKHGPSRQTAHKQIGVCKEGRRAYVRDVIWPTALSAWSFTLVQHLRLRRARCSKLVSSRSPLPEICTPTENDSHLCMLTRQSQPMCCQRIGCTSTCVHVYGRRTSRQ